MRLADVLTGAVQLADAILSVREGLDLLPTFAIGGGLKEWAETKLYGKPQAFTRLIRDISGLGYEYTVFDMSPGASLLERSIVAAVDEALPILRPEIFSVDGLEVFVETLNEIRNDLGGRVASSRLVVNGLNRSMPGSSVLRRFSRRKGAGSFHHPAISKNNQRANGLCFPRRICSRR